LSKIPIGINDKQNVNQLIITMKKFKWISSIAYAVAAFSLASALVVSCDDEDSPKELTLSSITAGSIDLNGATSATDVPTDAVITATFSTNVDPATVTTTNITLTRDYDDTVLPITVTSSENTITITPNEDLGTGTLYVLNIGAGLMSDKNKAFLGVERNFTTAGAFTPSAAIAHFTFEDTADDIVGTYDPTSSDVVDVTYVDSRNAAAGKAASFNGTTSIIEIPNASDFMANGDFSISFWAKPTFTEGKGQFVLGLAAWYGFQFEIADDWTWVKLALRYELPAGTDAEDSWYPGNGETRDNGGFAGTTINKDVTPPGVGDTYFKDKWVNVVVTYNATTKVNTMYINGEAVKEHDFDLFPSTNPKKDALGVIYAGNPAPGNKLALGFIQAREGRIVTDEWANPAITTNKHFTGLLDDLRIFAVPLTSTEVSLMYNSEKP
jgi:hypothetical protein